MWAARSLRMIITRRNCDVMRRDIASSTSPARGAAGPLIASACIPATRSGAERVDLSKNWEKKIQEISGTFVRRF